MGDQYEMQIEGLDELKQAFDRSPVEVGRILESATKDSGKEVQREAIMEAPHSTGNLQRSVHMEYEPIQVTISPTANYAAAVEFGTRPHGVDPRVLESWAAKKGLNPYAVAKSIAMRGTKANPFMQRTAEKTQSKIQNLFDKALNEITKFLTS